MSKNLKNIIIVTLLFIIVMIIFLPSKFIYPKNVNLFSDVTSFYFFSALLQANAAFFSIIIVALISKNQSLQSSINAIKTSLKDSKIIIAYPTWIIDFDKKKLKDKRKFLDESFKGGDKELKTHSEYWYEISKEKEKIKYFIKKQFSALLFISVVLFAVGICLSHKIHAIGGYVEYKVLSVCIIIEIGILFLGCVPILKVIDE
ncbi:MAG: hypothetical protein GY830_07720 [Bacteroidetes bacterium]|nr:hypothetical protein [Bacteroidota bacterium]